MAVVPDTGPIPNPRASGPLSKLTGIRTGLFEFAVPIRALPPAPACARWRDGAAADRAGCYSSSHGHGHGRRHGHSHIPPHAHAVDTTAACFAARTERCRCAGLSWPFCSRWAGAPRPRPPCCACPVPVAMARTIYMDMRAVNAHALVRLHWRDSLI